MRKHFAIKRDDDNRRSGCGWDECTKTTERPTATMTTLLVSVYVDNRDVLCASYVDWLSECMRVCVILFTDGCVSIHVYELRLLWRWKDNPIDFHCVLSIECSLLEKGLFCFRFVPFIYWFWIPEPICLFASSVVRYAESLNKNSPGFVRILRLPMLARARSLSILANDFNHTIRHSVQKMSSCILSGSVCVCVRERARAKWSSFGLVSCNWKLDCHSIYLGQMKEIEMKFSPFNGHQHHSLQQPTRASFETPWWRAEPQRKGGREGESGSEALSCSSYPRAQTRNQTHFMLCHNHEYTHTNTGTSIVDH